MKKIRTHRLLVALLVVFGVGLSVLYFSQPYQSQTGTVTEYEKKKKTVLKLTYATGDAAWNNAVSYAAEHFMEAYPEIRIAFEENEAEVQSGIYGDYIKKLIATDELGDIVEIRDANFMEETQLMAPIPEEVAQAAECIPWSDGLTYVVPEPRGIQGIIYNKKIFETLGISEPQSYQDFLAACERLKENKITPIVVGGKDIWHYGFWINHFFRTDVIAKDEEWEQKCSNGTASWTDEYATTMLEHLSALYQNGYVNADYRSVTDSETALRMADEHTAMLYSGPWMVPKIQELNEDISLGWFFLPDENGEKYALLDQTSGWGVTKACAADSEKYEAAKLFLKFLCSDEILSEMCYITNSIPAGGEEIDLSENPFLQEVQEKAEKGVQFSNRQIGDQWTPENFIWIMYERIPDFYDGKITVEEFEKELDEAWKKNTELE